MSAPASASSAPTAVDLFSGAGGLSEGLRQAGFQILAASDHDPDACATYRLNFPEVTMIEGDLTDRANHARLANLATPMNRELDLLAGGPPCQAFSQVRNHDRLLEDPRNRLYREFVNVLDELRPRALLLENVPGLLQFNAGEVCEQIEIDLSLGGSYDVRSQVLDAGDFSTPQSRSRLVFIGVRRGEVLPGRPAGSGLTSNVGLRRKSVRGRARYVLEGPEELVERLLDPADLAAVTAEQALSDLSRPGDRYSSDPRSVFQEAMRARSDAPQDHSPSRIREDTILRLKGIPPGGNVHDLPAELTERYLTGKKWGPAGNGKRLARRHFYAYRRLHPRWLAWTANTKADFAYHYRQPRGLSVREVARIQGFPDAFHVTTAPQGTPGQLYGGARHSRYRQIGNAVPPPLAVAVGREIRNALAAALIRAAGEPVPAQSDYLE
ncbi:MAG: DNA cytosine methyltransferase [Solirubrobacterales bacterium]|nr:DNA cytosine methyltransferase [Solirubrobacterales bacterium]